CYCSRIAQTATDFADASHSKSAKSATTTVSYGIFSSENAYPCTVTEKKNHGKKEMGFLAPAWNKWYNAPRSRKRVPELVFES
ncbi:hypothetical protein AAAY25_13550, partial [Brotaphodocola catenula]|uniref:hypothetical protein n=1 Tax=Brotaphodocola catenula TaxID=2885361 RepID=UPI0032BFB112